MAIGTGGRKPGNGRDVLVPAHHICNVTNSKIVNPAKDATALHNGGAHARQHVDQQLARCIRARKHVDMVVRHAAQSFDHPDAPRRADQCAKTIGAYAR